MFGWAGKSAEKTDAVGVWMDGWTSIPKLNL